MAGIDIIQQIHSEALKALQNQRKLEMNYLFELLNTTMQCVRNIHNTNNFMLMTINRCIDYTKASKGLKLKPKPETIDLLETISLPLNCMKDIQNRVSITMESIDDDICSHIITDKQWLQENILCLLSNAVKYSSGGEVVVRVYLAHDVMLSTASLEDIKWKRISSINSSHTPRKASIAVVPVNSDDDPNELMLDSRPSSAGSSRKSSNGEQQVDNVLRIEVEDTGIGMSEESMAALFSPFQQAQRLAGGTGLGLFSLAKRVEALRGKCGVSYRRDGRQGSLFWFTIPYRPDNQSAFNARKQSLYLVPDILDRLRVHNISSDAPTASEKTVSPALSSGRNHASMTDLSSVSTVLPVSASNITPIPPQTKGRVLLVDDTLSVVKMTSMLLRRAGWEVKVAENGAVALQMISEELAKEGANSQRPAFDVVLMDLQMPVMDGLEATKRLRQMETTTFRGLRHVVIGVSANNDEEMQQEAQATGFDAFLPKPLSISAFSELLEEVGGSFSADSAPPTPDVQV